MKVNLGERGGRGCPRMLAHTFGIGLLLLMLHLISAVSADITSGITSNITSAAGQKTQDFILIFLYLQIVARHAIISTSFTQPSLLFVEKG